MRAHSSQRCCGRLAGHHETCLAFIASDRADRIGALAAQLTSMNSILTLGVDPGLSGALALLNADGAPELVADLPIIRDRSLAWVDGGELQSMLLNAIGGRQCGAIIERVSAMPRQGIASAFCFGVGFGSILSALQAMHISIEFVTPTVWKKSYGLAKDKKASLHKARLLYPTAELHLAKHDGRSEALLIARYALSRRRTKTSC